MLKNVICAVSASYLIKQLLVINWTFALIIFAMFRFTFIRLAAAVGCQLLPDCLADRPLPLRAAEQCQAAATENSTRIHFKTLAGRQDHRKLSTQEAIQKRVRSHLNSYFFPPCSSIQHGGCNIRTLRYTSFLKETLTLSEPCTYI